MVPAWLAWRGADRDEIGLLLPWGPLALAVLALMLARSDRRARAAGYGVMLTITAAAELVLLGGAAWAAVLHALVVRGAAAAVVELVARAGMAIHGRGVAAIGLAILLAMPGAGATYLRFAAHDPVRATGRHVAVLAGVPLRWAEGPASLTRAGPGDGWRLLAGAFVLEPADDPGAATADRWLLVQPPAPGPAALVAIDARIRAGVRAVILTDPTLRWPSGYPPGHPAAPPRGGTLAPLLRHWGLRLVPRGDGIVRRDVRLAGRRWRLVLDAPGRFVATGPGPAQGAGPCRPALDGLLARCRIGRGQVVLLADSDLLHPLHWGDGRGGWPAAWRVSDNAAFVAALVAGLDRIGPPVRPVAWRAPAA